MTLVYKLVVLRNTKGATYFQFDLLKKEAFMKKKLVCLMAMCCMSLFLVACACGEDMGSENASPSPAATGQPTGTTAPSPTTAPTTTPIQNNDSDMNGNNVGGTDTDGMGGTGEDGLINDIGDGVGDVIDGVGNGVGDVIDGVGNAVDDMTGGNGANGTNDSAAGGAR